MTGICPKCKRELSGLMVDAFGFCEVHGKVPADWGTPLQEEDDMGGTFIHPDAVTIPAEDIRKGARHVITDARGDFTTWTALEDAELVLAKGDRPTKVVLAVEFTDRGRGERVWDPGQEVTVVPADREPSDVEIYGAGAR